MQMDQTARIISYGLDLVAQTKLLAPLARRLMDEKNITQIVLKMKLKNH